MKVEELVLALGNPREGEGAYHNFIVQNGREAWANIDRLEALSELKYLADSGKIALPPQRGGTNTHIHTNESFSIFRSPCDAAWHGFMEGLDVLGINDHYTISGHDEFRNACRILGLRATFSMEAVGQDEALKERGVRCNDPGNAGRTYLSAKGVTRPLRDGSQGRRDLDMMCKALRDRNEEIVSKLNAMFAKLQPRLALRFEDVIALTPRGNTTERHVCQAVAELIDREITDPAKRREYLNALAGSVSDDDLASEAAYQNMLRSALVKAGKPAYAEESAEAFLSWDSMCAMYLELGAIPTYPVLGNPITELEEDLDALLDQLGERGWHAIEVIPHRNTRERLTAILDAAAKRGCPVFNGTEHNTKTPMPLLDKLSASDEFIGQFKQGADVLIGHQVLGKYADLRYVDDSGNLTISDRSHGLELFGFVGRMVQKAETIVMLENLGVDAARSLLVALHDVAPCKTSWAIMSRAGVTAADLKGITVSEGRAAFASPAEKERFCNWAAANVV